MHFQGSELFCKTTVKIYMKLPHIVLYVFIGRLQTLLWVDFFQESPIVISRVTVRVRLEGDYICLALPAKKKKITTK